MESTYLNSQRGIFVSGLKEEVVTSAKAVMRIIKRGEANRHTSSTEYNEHSSRSHTIFQMVVESRENSESSKVQVSILVSLQPCSPFPSFFF